ncbi:hypothetical protein [Streptomyces sp. NPDC088739]|uniref:hypothetical protein n=1 Tax=Streptomyces sp. NPDC088739 TaxID=3365882 RepID=UPI003818F618
MSDDRLAGQGIMVIPDTFRTAAEGHAVINSLNDAVGTTTAAASMPFVVQVPVELMDRAEEVGAAVRDGALPEDLDGLYQLRHSTGGVVTVARREMS